MYPEGFEHWDMRAGAFGYTCPMCGERFHSKRRTGTTYCSAKCRKRASNGHKTFNTGFVCKHCGGHGFTAQPFQHPDYCSNACRQAAYRLRKASRANGD